MNEWLLFSFIFFGILSILAVSELLRKRYNKPPESTRKFIHICVGLVVSICPFIFKVNYQLITLSIIFIAINTFLISKNKVLSMNSIERFSYGTIYFPLSVLLLAIFFWDKPISYFLSVAILTFSDPIASAIGSRSQYHFKPWIDEKSIDGSLAMFCSSFLIVLIGTDTMARYYDSSFYLPFYILIGLALFTSLCATLSEMISNEGSDNLSIPLISFFSYEIFLINYTHGDLIHLSIWTVLSVSIFTGAYKYQSLDFSGAIGGFLIGVLIFGSGGWKLILPLVFFFLSSSLLSSLKNKPPSNRDLMQILANGGMPALFALIYFFFPNDILLLGYIGSLSASTADTWATEIGFLSKKNPYLVFSFKQVSKGESGSISAIGTIGSIAGAFILGIMCSYLFNINYLIVIVAIAGCMGSFIDTLLGSYLQGKYICIKCGQKTENKLHCNTETKLKTGYRFIDNNFVNFIANLAGSLTIILISLMYG